MREKESGGAKTGGKAGESENRLKAIESCSGLLGWTQGETPGSPAPGVSNRSTTALDQQPVGCLHCMSIKAIETKAYGRRFRSRLEARWAVFFTHMGLKWEYEPEGFDIDGVRYLPDFCVQTPQGEPVWYEIKPADVLEDSKFNTFTKALQEDFYQDGKQNGFPPRTELLSGPPHHVFENHLLCPRCGIVTGISGFDAYGTQEVSVYCWACDCETPSGGDNPSESDGVGGAVYCPSKGDIVTDRFVFLSLKEKLFEAIRASMAARFEHGESPQ